MMLVVVSNRTFFQPRTSCFFLIVKFKSHWINLFEKGGSVKWLVYRDFVNCWNVKCSSHLTVFFFLKVSTTACHQKLKNSASKRISLIGRCTYFRRQSKITARSCFCYRSGVKLLSFFNPRRPIMSNDSRFNFISTLLRPMKTHQLNRFLGHVKRAPLTRICVQKKINWAFISGGVIIVQVVAAKKTASVCVPGKMLSIFHSPLKSQIKK